jgi:hypothetical protein
LSGRVEGKDLDEYDASDFLYAGEVERLMEEANTDKKDMLDEDD